MSDNEFNPADPTGSMSSEEREALESIPAQNQLAPPANTQSAGTTGGQSAGTTGGQSAGTTGDHSAGTTGDHSAGTTGENSAGTTGDTQLAQPANTQLAQSALHEILANEQINQLQHMIRLQQDALTRYENEKHAMNERNDDQTQNFRELEAQFNALQASQSDHVQQELPSTQRTIKEPALPLPSPNPLSKMQADLWFMQFKKQQPTPKELDTDSTKMTVTSFIKRMETLRSTFFNPLFNPEANDSALLQFVEPGFTDKLAADLETNGGRQTWSSLKHWLLTRGNLPMVSQDARDALAAHTQGGDSLSEMTSKMDEIDANITDHPLKATDYQRFWCNAI
jgi:hypothetical protein